MKKILLSSLLLAAMCSGAYAQNGDVEPKEGRGWYIKGGASYFIKVTPVEFPNVGTLQPRIIIGSLTPAGSVTTSEETITGSFGEGYRFDINPGYSFNKYFGIEVGLHYYKSEEKQMAKTTLADAITPAAAGTNALTIDAKGNVTAFDIAPSLVFKLPMKGGWEPYSRIGVIVPIHGRLEIKTDIFDRYGVTTKDLSPTTPLYNVSIHREEEISPRPTIGFLGVVGLNYPIAKRLKAYAEVEYRNVSVSSKSKEIKVFDLTANAGAANGPVITRSVADLTTAQRETTYENVVYPGQPQDPNTPSKDLRSYINIGGLGFGVGVKFDF